MVNADAEKCNCAGRKNEHSPKRHTLRERPRFTEGTRYQTFGPINPNALKDIR